MLAVKRGEGRSGLVPEQIRRLWFFLLRRETETGISTKQNKTNKNCPRIGEEKLKNIVNSNWQPLVIFLRYGL